LQRQDSAAAIGEVTREAGLVEVDAAVMVTLWNSFVSVKRSVMSLLAMIPLSSTNQS
jgi:hypothetical protein